MAVTRLQGVTSNAAGQTSATFGSACTPGSTLTVTLRVGNTTDVPTVSDATNGSWTNDASQVQTTDGHKAWIFRFTNNTSSAALTVSFGSLSAGCRYVMEEWSGLATSTPIRTGPVSSQVAGGTSVSSGNLTATSGDLCYGAGTNGNGAAFDWTAGGTSAGGAWATGGDEISSAHPIYTQYVVATAGGTFASQPVYGQADNLTSLFIIYKAAGGGGASPVIVGSKVVNKVAQLVGQKLTTRGGVFPRFLYPNFIQISLKAEMVLRIVGQKRARQVAESLQHVPKRTRVSVPTILGAAAPNPPVITALRICGSMRARLAAERGMHVPHRTTIGRPTVVAPALQPPVRVGIQVYNHNAILVSRGRQFVQQRNHRAVAIVSPVNAGGGTTMTGGLMGRRRRYDRRRDSV